MDPRTGQFHELEKENIFIELFKKGNEQRRASETMGHPLHPSHRRLVIKATQKPIPKDWPVFTVGESYEVCGRLLEIAQITAKDIWLRGENDGIERGASCTLQGREFRVRLTRGHFTVVRPIIGNVVRT